MMKTAITIATLSVLLGWLAPGQTNSITAINAPSPLEMSAQLVVVTTRNWDAVPGLMRRFTRTNAMSPWHEVGAAIPVVVGRSGLGWGRGINPPANLPGPLKQEGDGKSPAGIFRLSSTFGLAAPDQMKGVKLPYRQLTGGIECVDDFKSVHYNSIVDREKTPRPDWDSSEKMRAVGDPYRLGIVVDHNIDPVKSDAGSCIFLHLWDNDHTGTSGCTAMAPANMEILLPWLVPEAKPVLVQLTENDYRRLKTTWRLP